MPEQQDLEFLRTLRSAQQHDQLQQPAEPQIDERPSPRRTSEVGEEEAIDLRGRRRSPTTNRVSEPHAIISALGQRAVVSAPVPRAGFETALEVFDGL